MMTIVGLAPADEDPTFQRTEGFTALCSPCGFMFFVEEKYQRRCNSFAEITIFYSRKM